MTRSHALAVALTAVMTLLALTGAIALAQDEEPTEVRRLAVLWTSGDPDVAHRMALMYTHAARTADWWDEVVLIVWGPSQRLLVGDHAVQDKVNAMMEDGIEVRACIMCAQSYGVVEELRGLGLEVLPMGQPLTEYLQSGWTVLTL